MKLERIVQLHVAVLAVLGAVLLGMGQQSPVLPLLAVFAAVTSVLFTDILGWFRLNRFVANLAALVALFFSVNDFIQPDMRAQLLAIANLLIYLQIVLFYQQKNWRLYWQLTVLSLLQVVVSAALNVGLEFGLVLILYALAAFSTLAVLHVHREASRVAESASRLRSQRAAKPAFGKASRRWERWLRREPVTRPLTSPARLGRQVMASGLLRQIAAIGLSTLIFAFVLFFTAPRLDSSLRRGYQIRPVRVVGFSEEMTLDEMASVLESTEAVMRVSFRDAAHGQPYRVYGEPYFRGGVLTEYRVEDGAGAWRPPNRRPTEGEFQFPWLAPKAASAAPLRAPPPNRTLVRQDVTLQPLNERVLFAIYPCYGCDQTPPDVWFQPHTEQLFCKTPPAERPRQEYRYSVVTTGLLGGVQLDVSPLASGMARMMDPALLAFDEARLPTLKKIADQIAETRKATGGKRADLVRALRDHFLKPGVYNYTLDFARVRRRRGLDPIEDFVANHRSGHCEYFASALVMMLRSQHIPARMVVGFRGGEYNALGDYYQVLQRHAHAWVEAYLPPEEAESELPPEAVRTPLGGWLRVDPTPGSDVDRARQLQQGWVDVVDDVLDYARTMWTDYILGLTAKRQQETIFEPVANRASPETWASVLHGLDAARRRALEGAQSVSPILVAVLFIALTIGVGSYLLRGRTNGGESPGAGVWLWRRANGESAHQPRTSLLTVKFYRRLEAALNQLGLSRSAGQTPRELACQARERLAALSPQSDVAELPRRIVEILYRVRFGNSDHPDDDRRALADLLGNLEEAVSRIVDHPEPPPQP